MNNYVYKWNTYQVFTAFVGKYQQSCNAYTVVVVKVPCLTYTIDDNYCWKRTNPTKLSLNFENVVLFSIDLPLRGSLLFRWQQ